MRVSPTDLRTEAVVTLSAALEAVGLHPRRETHIDDGLADLVVDDGGEPLVLDVVATSIVDPGRAATLMSRQRDRDLGVPVLVADQISEGARELLRDGGWGYLDRRGRLWLRGHGLVINTDVEARPRSGSDTSTQSPLTARVGTGIAVILLSDPRTPQTVRGFARTLSCAPSTAHHALERLKVAGLVRRDNTPLFPELFWATADAWAPERTYVGRAPSPGDDVAELDLGVDASRWVVSSDLAAAAWGAPVVVSSGAPVDFYVPRDVVARAARVLGPGSPADYGATLTPDPFGFILERSYPNTSYATPWSHWSLAHPVVVALDLARDRARGREILSDWTPPPEFIRVW
jgi:hypothetical protein